MKKTFFFFLLSMLFGISSGYSQGYNVVNGFLVLNNGDTLRGSLKERANLGNTVSIQTNGAAGFSDFTIDQVRAISYENGSYFKPMPSEGRFLLCLVEGPMDLYKFQDYYFVQKKGEAPVKLDKVSAKEAASNKGREDQRFRALLKYLMSDCPKVQQQAENVEFGDYALIRLIEKYNACKDPAFKSTSHRKSLKLTVHKGIRGGVAFHHSRLNDQNNSLASGGRTVDLSAQTTFSAGIWLNLAFRNQLSFQPELLFIRKKGSFSGKISGIYDLSYDVDQTWLQLPLCVYYTFPLGKTRPFLSAGLPFGWAMKSEGSKNFIGNINPIPLKNWEYGIRGSAGLEFKMTPKRSFYLEYLYESTYVGFKIYGPAGHVKNFTHHVSARVSF
ncbi:MAG: PorT family protein [Bacteroidetes bacterium]|nr:PorT family protein [Bacteroidota bacterium]